MQRTDFHERRQRLASVARVVQHCSSSLGKDGQRIRSNVKCCTSLAVVQSARSCTLSALGRVSEWQLDMAPI